MIVADERLHSVFHEVAQHVRTSVRQPRDSIIRESRRRLSRDASDIAAIHVIAAAKLCDRDPNQSLSILRNEAAALYGNATGHRLAGYAHLAKREMDAAGQHFGQAVRIDPHQCDSWTILGGIHETTGHTERAISYYRRALVFEDQGHESALALSRIYAAQKDVLRAIDTLRFSLLRDQRSATLNLALAKLLEQRAAMLRRARKWRSQQRLLEEARRCYRVVLAVEPTSKVWLALGLLEQRMGRNDESRHAFEMAVELAPESPAALTHLANAHLEDGNLGIALQHYEQSLQLDPNRAATHFRYSRSKKFSPGVESQRYLESLVKLADDSERPAADQVHFNFALAKVLDDAAQYDRAWDRYDRANRLKPGHSDRHTPAFDLDDIVEDAIQAYAPDLVRRQQRTANRSSAPIFIVGMPRSGTTLTEQILSSHPSIAGGGELKQIERLRQQILRHAHRQFGKSPGRSKTRPSYPQAVRSTSDALFQHLAEQHLGYLRGLGRGAPHVTDKMPTNFIHLGLIACLFPEATVIHCQRHPMDVLVSCYCQNLNAPFCDLEALVEYHRGYRRLMRHWQSTLPLRIHAVDYEALVSDPEPNIRAMIEQCRLPWSDQCLQHQSNRRTVKTPSKWQVRQPMYQSSIEKWRRFEPQLREIADRIDRELQGES